MPPSLYGSGLSPTPPLGRAAHRGLTSLYVCVSWPLSSSNRSGRPRRRGGTSCGGQSRATITYGPCSAAILPPPSPAPVRAAASGNRSGRSGRRNRTPCCGQSRAAIAYSPRSAAILPPPRPAPVRAAASVSLILSSPGSCVQTRRSALPRWRKLLLRKDSMLPEVSLTLFPASCPELSRQPREVSHQPKIQREAPRHSHPSLQPRVQAGVLLSRRTRW